MLLIDSSKVVSEIPLTCIVFHIYKIYYFKLLAQITLTS